MRSTQKPSNEPTVNQTTNISLSKQITSSTPPHKNTPNAWIKTEEWTVLLTMPDISVLIPDLKTSNLGTVGRGKGRDFGTWGHEKEFLSSDEWHREEGKTSGPMTDSCGKKSVAQTGGHRP